MMKFPNILVVSQLLLAVGTSAIIMPAPEGADCWSELSSIYVHEVIGNGTLYDQTVERKYTLCSDTVFTVSTWFEDPGFDITNPVGWPLAIATPNMHIYCEKNCTIMENFRAPDAYIKSLVVAPTSELQANMDVNSNYTNKSTGDNTLIEGVTFVINNPLDGPYVGVDIQNQARNFTLKSCTFEGNVLAAVRSQYISSEHTTENRKEREQTVFIQDTIFQDLKASHGAVIATSDSASGLPRGRITHEYNLENVQFNNVESETALVNFEAFTNVVMNQVDISDCVAVEAMFLMVNRDFTVSNITATDYLVTENPCAEPCKGDILFYPFPTLGACTSFNRSQSCVTQIPTLRPTNLMVFPPTMSPVVATGSPTTNKTLDPDAGEKSASKPFALANLISAILCIVPFYLVLA